MKKKTSLILILLIVLAVGALIFTNSQLAPVSKQSEEVNFVIDESDNLTSITSKLETEEIIKSKNFAKIYGKLSKTSQFVKGRFTLDKSWDTKEILKHLTDVNNASGEIEVVVTLIPGSWAKDMAKELGSKLDLSSDDLLNLWNNEEYVKSQIQKYEFLSDDILNPELRVMLEGYLAPNTYNFYINASAEDVTSVLLNETNRIYNKYKAEFDASKYSVHEIFTLASITQYESGNYADDQIIAGVWNNRLNQNMMLQSSVTVCYSLYDFEDWKDCETKTNIDSPFNTYKNFGIPIGPILNAGEDSIKATLYPKDNDYLYFVADVYGDNTVYYAKTYEEHLANVKKYLGY